MRKGYNLCLAVIASLLLSNISYAASTTCKTIKIVNQVEGIPGCSKDCNKSASLQYFATNVPSKGETVSNQSAYSKNIPPLSASADNKFKFGLQINAAFVGNPDANGKVKCDQLCNNITLDVKTGKITESKTKNCGSNSNAPTWTLGSSSGSISNDICVVTIDEPHLNNTQSCYCAWGAYPCSWPTKKADKVP